jgi:hypothetical protein
MNSKPANPLAKHFRRAAIHYKLPSGGKFWPENSLDLPVTGQIPVYPMTTTDEITLKTPDALMNGSGIVSVMESCCPSIRDAWQMPSIDVDATLIAIRIASYGQSMTISTKCPGCSEENDYDLNLSNILDGISCPDYDTPVTWEDLKIKLRPQPYLNVNQANIISFEEQRIIQMLNDSTLTDEERSVKMAQSMKNLLEANTNSMVNSTEYIENEDGIKVTDPDHIREFYQNASAQVTKFIEKRLADIATEGALPLSTVGCAKCQQTFQVPLEFDYARFFAQGS